MKNPLKDASVEEGVGVALGMLAGGVAGAAAGPVGIAVGASLGTALGEVAGRVLHKSAVAASDHDHELDDAIGINGGSMGRGEVLGFADGPKVSTFLRADHDELTAFAERVLDAVRNGDRTEAAEAVAALEAAITAHLAQEERDLLPAYAEQAPEDAEAILADHAAIRKALAGFDVASDLHLVRAEAVKAFLDALHAHAERENGGLYRWAAAEG